MNDGNSAALEEMQNEEMKRDFNSDFDSGFGNVNEIDDAWEEEQARLFL